MTLYARRPPDISPAGSCTAGSMPSSVRPRSRCGSSPRRPITSSPPTRTATATACVPPTSTAVSIRRSACPTSWATTLRACGLACCPGCRTWTASAAALDGVRIGSARILTMSPSGTATSGTLYLQGRRAQYRRARARRDRTHPHPQVRHRSRNVDQPLTDRRIDARFPPPARAATRATLRPGCPVVLVDFSAGGALVEASRPLRPGARVHLQP